MPKIGGKEISPMALLGPVAFYVGLLVTLGAAFVTPSGALYLVLGVIGVIVGLLNITAKETGPFLFASIAFIVAAIGMDSLITAAGVAIPAELVRLAANITVLVGAAAMVISLRAIFEIAKSK